MSNGEQTEPVNIGAELNEMAKNPSSLSTESLVLINNNNKLIPILLTRFTKITSFLIHTWNLNNKALIRRYLIKC